MREKKFTPGPWEVMNSAAIWMVYGPIGERVCRLLFPDIHAQREANANLIAAAPELLEALEAVTDLQYDERKTSCYAESKKAWVNDNFRAIDKARSAIKKAYGETE